MNPTPQSPEPHEPVAWWKVPTVWLVIGGPAAVIVAGFVTLGLALSHPDEVLRTAPASADAAADGVATPAAQLPAVQGRNHAATGGR